MMSTPQQAAVVSHFKRLQAQLERFWVTRLTTPTVPTLKPWSSWVEKIGLIKIKVNKVINMKEALMYMYTVKEIFVDHRFF